MSNGDNIRAMSDRELSYFLFVWQNNYVINLRSGLARAQNLDVIEDWLATPVATSDFFERWDEIE